MIKKLLTVLLFVALSFSTGIKPASAGISPVNIWAPFLTTEGTTIALLSYFDLRNRNTQVQVTNTSPIDPIQIHVQIFADQLDCVDVNFLDDLTPNETHVYDIRNLVKADGSAVEAAIPDNSHGFVIISQVLFSAEDALVGNFRITDNSGYEYRVNSAFFLDDDDAPPLIFDLIGRFSDDWGAAFSDIVGVRSVFTVDMETGILDFTPQITDPYELFVYDDDEEMLSCGQVQFGCDEIPGDGDLVQNFIAQDLLFPLLSFAFNDGIDFPEFTDEFINQGINPNFPNSRDGRLLCPPDLKTDGFISLTPATNIIILDTVIIDLLQDPYDFVGFIGLNDGAGRGSMDRFKTINIDEAPIVAGPPGP